MLLSESTIEKLNFLIRVVQKEILLLEYAAGEAFADGLNLDTIKNLDSNPVLALKLEAFSSRFCRLQDTVGDKLLSVLLYALQEPKSPFLDTLNKAESFGWLDSAENWIALRQLRNQMVHEYIEDVHLFYTAIISAHDHVSTLKQFGNRLIGQSLELLQKSEEVVKHD